MAQLIIRENKQTLRHSEVRNRKNDFVCHGLIEGGPEFKCSVPGRGIEMNNNIASATRQLYFPQPLTRLLVCWIASSVIHKPCPPSPNSFLKQRNVHPQIQRKGRICIRRYYTIHLVSPIYFRTVNLPISKYSFNIGRTTSGWRPGAESAGPRNCTCEARRIVSGPKVRFIYSLKLYSP